MIRVRRVIYCLFSLEGVYFLFVCCPIFQCLGRWICSMWCARVSRSWTNRVFLYHPHFFVFLSVLNLVLDDLWCYVFFIVFLASSHDCDLHMFIVWNINEMECVFLFLRCQIRQCLVDESAASGVPQDSICRGGLGGWTPTVRLLDPTSSLKKRLGGSVSDPLPV